MMVNDAHEGPSATFQVPQLDDPKVENLEQLPASQTAGKQSIQLQPKQD
jgi:hypothetical protein